MKLLIGMISLLAITSTVQAATASKADPEKVLYCTVNQSDDSYQIDIKLKRQPISDQLDHFNTEVGPKILRAFDVYTATQKIGNYDVDFDYSKVSGLTITTHVAGIEISTEGTVRLGQRKDVLSGTEPQLNVGEQGSDNSIGVLCESIDR